MLPSSYSSTLSPNEDHRTPQNNLSVYQYNTLMSREPRLGKLIATPFSQLFSFSPSLPLPFTMCACVCIYVEVSGEHVFYSITLPLFFEIGSFQVSDTDWSPSPMDLWGSTSPVLGLQVCKTHPAFLWLLELKLGSHVYLPNEPSPQT